jgi:uncharacterized membrane protein YoaK (UPF0700 family)
VLSTEAKTLKARGLLAVSLGWVAGFTNVVVLIRCGETVSHQTGNTTRLAVAIADLFRHQPEAWNVARFFLGLVASFFGGALVAGWMTEGAPRRFRYAGPISLEAILLTALYWMLTAGVPAGPCAMLAAAAMGLQNGTITRISGAVVRTTHLTGVVTDLALDTVQLARWAAGPKADRLWAQPAARRWVLLACIYGSFLTGGIAGGIFERLFGPGAVLIPVVFLTGLVVWTAARATRGSGALQTSAPDAR